MPYVATFLCIHTLYTADNNKPYLSVEVFSIAVIIGDTVNNKVI